MGSQWKVKVRLLRRLLVQGEAMEVKRKKLIVKLASTGLSVFFADDENETLTWELHIIFCSVVGLKNMCTFIATL